MNLSVLVLNLVVFWPFATPSRRLFPRLQVFTPTTVPTIGPRDHYTITNDACWRDVTFGFTRNVGRLTPNSGTAAKAMLCNPANHF